MKDKEKVEIPESSTALVVERMKDNTPPTITFSKVDMFLGHKLHNRPLLVSGYACGTKIGRILVDPGSSIKIISLKTIKEIGLGVEDLTGGRLRIQGFNQGGEWTIGRVCLTLKMGDCRTCAMTARAPPRALAPGCIFLLR